MSELVQMENGDNLLSESALSGKNSEEIAAMINQTETNVPQDAAEPEEQNTQEQELEQAPLEQTVEQPEQVEQQKPEIDYNQIYQKGVQDALSQLKELIPQQQTKEPAKKVSPDEAIEKFSADPEAYIASLIESKITPHKAEIAKIEEQTVRAQARRHNQDFARLEPIIDKIRDVHPNLVKGKSASETIEVYYLLAKGLEAQEKEKQNQSASDKEAADRRNSKRDASILPKGTRKTVATQDDKPFETLKADEMAKRIAQMVRGR